MNAPELFRGRSLGPHMAQDLHRTLTIIRRRQVEARTGLSRSAIYLRVSEGTFPRPVKLGARAVGWIGEEIDDWLRARVAESRKVVS